MSKNMHLGKKKGYMYLQSIGWQTQSFTNQQLETMLGAACLRFLGDLEDISFVFALSKGISTKYKNSIKLALYYCTEALNDLANKIEYKEISLHEKEQIKTIVNEAQEIITGIAYSNVAI